MAGVADLVIEGVKKRFTSTQAATLDGISLRVAAGERVVIVGPSGCGKSTLLRMIAGLDEPDEGRIELGGRALRGVAPQERDVAMVFQGYALYPHMTAAENIAFPLKMRGATKEEQKRAVSDVAAVLRIEGLLERVPGRLSGGERQRVAIGRALVRRPKAFLFDEPLSNLDAALRNDLRTELAQILRKLEGACIYVTHDQVEAMTLGDRIVVMSRGRILQVDTPRAIYETPADAFVATFVGTPKMNLIAGKVEGGDLVAGPFRIPSPRAGLPASLLVGVRPEDLELTDEGSAIGTIVSTEPLGAETILLVRTGDVDLRLKRSGFDTRRPGDSVHLRVDPARLHFFANENELGERPRIA